MATKIFLDSTTFIGAFTKRSPASVLILESPIEKCTNEYVIKEIRRILKDEYPFTSDQINRAVAHIESKCEILKTPSAEEYSKIGIRDKSDRPIICSAKKIGAILITDDYLLYHDAKKYVVSKRPEEFLNETSL